MAAIGRGDYAVARSLLEALLADVKGRLYPQHAICYNVQHRLLFYYWLFLIIHKVWLKQNERAHYNSGNNEDAAAHGSEFHFARGL